MQNKKQGYSIIIIVLYRILYGIMHYNYYNAKNNKGDKYGKCI